jgi:outer membrane protein TolC
MRILRRVLCLLLIIFSLSAWSATVRAVAEQKPLQKIEQEPGANEELTLERTVQLALARNPQLLLSQEEIEAAENIRKRAWSQFFFKVKGNYSYTRLHKAPILEGLNIPGFPDEIRIGTEDNFNFNAAVQQPLFTGFSIVTQYELTKLGFDIAKVRYKAAKFDLIRDVKIGFFSILRAEKGVIVAEQAVQQLESQGKRAYDFYQVGMTPKNDYLKAHVELANAEQELIVAHNRVQVVKADFNTLLKFPVDNPIKVKDILNYRPLKLELEKAYEEAHINRPQLAEAKLAIEVALKEVKLAQSGYYPSIALNLNYSKFGDTYKLNGSPFQREEEWNVTTALEWTFWEWGSTGHEVAEKRNRVKQANHALQAVQDSVDLEVKRAYLILREAEKNIRVAEASIEEAEENYRMEVERYKQQINTNTDVLEAQFLLARARDNHYNALYRYNIAVAELQRAMGMAE